MALRLLRGGCRALPAAKPPHATLATSSAAASKKKAAAAPAASGSNAFLKQVPVTPALATFLGAPNASRADAVKKVWAYIKLHNLQNPANKREIHCDQKLKTIFDGKDKVGFLEVAKLLSNHFVKTDK